MTMRFKQSLKYNIKMLFSISSRRYCFAFFSPSFSKKTILIQAKVTLRSIPMKIVINKNRYFNHHQTEEDISRGSHNIVMPVNIYGCIQKIDKKSIFNGHMLNG